MKDSTSKCTATRISSPTFCHTQPINEPVRLIIEAGSGALGNSRTILGCQNQVSVDGADNVGVHIKSAYCKGCKMRLPFGHFISHASDKTYKQCNDCRQRYFARRHPTSPQAHLTYPTTNKNYVINNQLPEIADMDANDQLKHCKHCKKKCPIDMFSDRTGQIFATCVDCRICDTFWRHPQLFRQPSDNKIQYNNLGDEVEI